MSKNMNKLKIGYWPNSLTFDAPGDRRRFIFYAENKKIDFELFRPGQKYDLVYLSQAAVPHVGAFTLSRNRNIVHTCADHLRIMSTLLHMH